MLEIKGTFDLGRTIRCTEDAHRVIHGVGVRRVLFKKDYTDSNVLSECIRYSEYCQNENNEVSQSN
jgi:hypothetical protein